MKPFDFNKELINFTYDDNIQFNKSQQTLLNNNIRKTFESLYDFKRCKVGDKIYVSDELGYNLQEGELVGYCAIEVDDLHMFPMFVYKQQLPYTYQIVRKQAQAAVKSLGDNFYLPTISDLMKLFVYLYENKNFLKINLNKNQTFWSSTSDKSLRNECAEIQPDCLYRITVQKNMHCQVLPFFTIPKNNKIILERHDFNKDLMTIDDELSFNKSNNTLEKIYTRELDKNIYNFENCKPGDKVFYDDKLGYNLYSGRFEGWCAIAANDMNDNKPRFVYKTFVRLCSWSNKSAIKAAEKFGIHDNFYLPGRGQVIIFIRNNQENNYFADLAEGVYWTSTDAGNNYAYCFNKELTYIDGKPEKHLVLPFFTIPENNGQVNESYNFNKALISFDDEISFDKSDTSKVVNKNVGDITDKIQMANIDIKKAISKLTGLYELPYVKTIVEQDNDMVPQQMYVLDSKGQKNIQVYDIVDLDGYLKMCGWITISNKDYKELKNDESSLLFKIINNIKKYYYNDDIDQTFDLYLSPDNGICIIFQDKVFYKFMLTGLVFYNDCIIGNENNDLNNIKKTFINKTLKPMVSKRIFKDRLSNIVVNIDQDNNKPYINFSLSNKTITAPVYIKLILQDIGETTKLISYPLEIYNYLKYDKFRKKYMYNGEEVISQYVSKDLNVYVMYSTIMDNLSTYRHILRITPLDIV